MKITVKLNGETAKVGPPEWGSGPDYFSFWSHFLGALFAVFATIQLLSIQGASVEKQVACLIYGACAVMMLSCSALHHAVQKPVSLPIQLLLRRWDHVSIYVFIAGSYTPIMVGSNLGLYTSRTILTAVWVLAVIGGCQKLFFNFSTMCYVTISTYICQGWACIKISVNNMSLYHAIINSYHENTWTDLLNSQTPLAGRSGCARSCFSTSRQCAT
ncbi:hemolysin-III related-domain-containing protein [Baffinella frigidus]|nr:hemolysin-III related-domain-containing protein [Cryptophyta sp. CCMP2293]